MADGDTSEIVTGKWRGKTRLDIERTTATTHILKTPTSTTRLFIADMQLMVVGASITARVQEETSDEVLAGPDNIPAGASGGLMTIDNEDEAIVTKVKGKAANLVLSATAPIYGWIIYDEI